MKQTPDKPAVDVQKAASKTPKGRSPAYPGIDLKRAIELASVVYKAERLHPVASETVAHHWKLQKNSSQFLTSISALKKFGLVEALPQRSANSGQVKVSDLARDIIVDEREDSQEREAAIKRAALKPEIHADLWRKYNGELPSDSNLRFHLIRDLKFTEVGAVDFILQFKRTIQFANLGSSDTLSPLNSDNVEAGEAESTARVYELMDRLEGFPHRPSQAVPPPAPAPALRAGIREVPIPIQGIAWPALRAVFPMSPEAWDQMIAVLNAMKPGLVQTQPLQAAVSEKIAMSEKPESSKANNE